MNYSTFISKLLQEKLIKKESLGFVQIEKTLIRAKKDLSTARLIQNKDEALAYTAAYDAMLRAGRAYMFMKGFRPTVKYQHKTVVDFTEIALQLDFPNTSECRYFNYTTIQSEVKFTHDYLEENSIKNFVVGTPSLLSSTRPPDFRRGRKDI